MPRIKFLFIKMDNIEKKIELILQKERELGFLKAQLLDERLQLLKIKQPVYYQIICHPPKNNIDSHVRGLFTTYKKAESILPINSEWTYLIIPVDSTILYKYDFEFIDKTPDNFPY